MNPRIRQLGPLARLLAVVAVLAAAAGMAAERANAAFSAKIVNNTLRVEGDSASDKLALRLQAGSPQILQVDVGDDGSANFSFDRGKFNRIVVAAGRGDDAVRIDEANGAFSNDEETTMRGEAGNDTLLGGSGDEAITGDDGDDLSTGTGATTTTSAAASTTTRSSGIPATAATASPPAVATTGSSSTGRGPRRSSSSRPTAPRLGSSVTSAASS